MRFLGQLKQHTAESHASLEQGMAVFDRVKTKSDYRALLQKFFTLYEPLEKRLAGAADWVALGWDFPAEMKTPLLRADLQALGANDGELAAWPRATVLPALDEPGAAVGSLYVLEGSTLGGQMISRRFAAELGITPGAGGEFFNGYGADTGTHWRKFGQWAEIQSEQHPENFEAGAVRGARETFNCFAQWLT